MRDDHHDFQTPKQERLPAISNRKAKSQNAPLNKLHHQHQKSLKKNLSSVFTPITEEDDLVISSSEKESIEKISLVSDSIDIDRSTIEISKSSLNSGNTLVSDNTVALHHPEESAGASPISETFVFEEDQSSESIESYIASLNQFVSTSSVIPISIDLTPFSTTSPTLSSISTVEMTPSSSTLTSDHEAAAGLVSSVTRDGATAEEIRSLELQSLVKHLRVSMLQVLHSADIDPQYKGILDALVKMMIKEFYGLHQERGMVVNQLFSRILIVVLLTFLLIVLAGFIIFSDVQSSYNGLKPT